MTKPKAMASYADMLARCKRVKEPWLSRPCQLWQGGVTSRGRPAAQLVRRDDAERRVFTEGQKITASLLGLSAPAGKLWTSRCGHPLCLAREHLVAMTRSELQARANETRGVDSVSVANEARRRLGMTKPEWMRQWAVESPQSARDVARALGVGESTVWGWRKKASEIRGDSLPSAWDAMLGSLRAMAKEIEAEVV